jgi:hypothetical protein
MIYYSSIPSEESLKDVMINDPLVKWIDKEAKVSKRADK